MNKKQKQQELNKQLEHQSIINRGLIRDRYPAIKRIKVKKEFFSSETDKKYLEQNDEQRPEHYATFKIECTDRECVDGGFDLDEVVDCMVKKIYSLLLVEWYVVGGRMRKGEIEINVVTH